MPSKLFHLIYRLNKSIKLLKKFLRRVKTVCPKNSMSGIYYPDNESRNTSEREVFESETTLRRHGVQYTYISN